MAKKKLGLVLEGGGVKGAYQVGAIRALIEAGYSFDSVAGTSIGALNGATYASQGFSSLLEKWEIVKFSDVFEFNEEMVARFKKKDFDLDSIVATGKKLLTAREIIKESYDAAVDFVKSNLDENEIRNCKMDFGCVTYNLTDMKPFEAMKNDIPQGQMIDYIIASASFPIFPPKVIDDKKFIDGGVYDNLPINLLAKSGIRKMVVIRTNPDTKPPKRKIERTDLEILYITPPASLGKAMAFSPSRIEQLMDKGYHEAKKTLKANDIQI